MKNSKRVLVAGGAGFIGSHTAVELIGAGYDVVVVDDLSNSNIDAIRGVEKIVGRAVDFVQGDCCDKALMSKLFDKYDFNTVIHFAAFKAVGESVGEPLMYYYNNLTSLMVLMELMQERGVENLVFSSSCTVYGQPDVLPVTEQTPRQVATSPYGNTKQISEDIIRDMAFAHQNFKAIALRYFNPIGSHPSALIGELPNGVPNNLIPYLTQTAIGMRECLSVYGDDYNTPDGSAIRDYIDVVDLAKAHVVAVDRMVGNKSKERYEIFNIGTGRGLSVLELIEAFQRATGVKVNHRIVGRRAGDIEQIWAETSYANSELGWRAERSIDQTLLSAWHWQQKLSGQK